MTEHDICISYREAKNKKKQIQILADLNELRRTEIIGILLKNGENVMEQEIEQLYKRLDTLERQIAEREKEYGIIVRALAGGKKNGGFIGKRIIRQ